MIEALQHTLAEPEVQGVSINDFNRLSSSWVATPTTLMTAYGEATKAAQFNSTTGHHDVGYLLKENIDGALDLVAMQAWHLASERLQ